MNDNPRIDVFMQNNKQMPTDNQIRLSGLKGPGWILMRKDRNGDRVHIEEFVGRPSLFQRIRVWLLRPLGYSMYASDRMCWMGTDDELKQYLGWE